MQTESVQTIAEAAELASMFKNEIEFSCFVEQRALEHEVTNLEFLTHYVTQNSIDEAEVVPMLTSALKNKLFEEAKKSHSMPKRTETDLFED